MGDEWMNERMNAYVAFVRIKCRHTTKPRPKDPLTLTLTHTHALLHTHTNRCTPFKNRQNCIRHKTIARAACNVANHSDTAHEQIKRSSKQFGFACYLLLKCYLLFEHGTELKCNRKKTKETL